MVLVKLETYIAGAAGPVKPICHWNGDCDLWYISANHGYLGKATKIVGHQITRCVLALS